MSEKIKIRKTDKADTRFSVYSKTSKKELLENSKLHIEDLENTMKLLAYKIINQAKAHDRDKITRLDHFYECFKTGFSDDSWYENHKKASRHHLNDKNGVRDDVNLIDVLEMICDCITAGLARSGKVYEIEIDSKVLMKAFTNTCTLVINSVEVEDEK